EMRMDEAHRDITSLRDESAREREGIRQQETARGELLQQQLRAAEADRDQLRREIHVLQAAAVSSGESGNGDSLGPVMAELGGMRRQLGETQSQLSEAKAQ